MKDKIKKEKAHWKKVLSQDEYRVTREGGTERAFTGKYYDHKEVGIYNCSNCGNRLFSSENKYDSGSGWPSFWDVIEEDSIDKRSDKSLGMERVEVLCARCGAHLGHLFDDGPTPTGKRYCINSLSLSFKKKDS